MIFKKPTIEKLRKQASKKELCFRTCWNCNPAHEHLKEAKYRILCPQCGHWFYKGVDITKDSD